MSAPIVFLDTETTGLSLDDEIWEFAAIRREPDGTEVEHHLFIEHDPAKCDRLPESFAADHAASDGRRARRASDLGQDHAADGGGPVSVILPEGGHGPQPKPDLALPRSGRRMRRESPERAKQMAVYRHLRVLFLSSRPLCESPWPCGRRATEVHHMAGREGDRLLDETRWLPLCHDCHQWATEHPQQAIEDGVSLPRIAERAS